MPVNKSIPNEMGYSITYWVISEILQARGANCIKFTVQGYVNSSVAKPAAELTLEISDTMKAEMEWKNQDAQRQAREQFEVDNAEAIDAHNLASQENAEIEQHNAQFPDDQKELKVVPKLPVFTFTPEFNPVSFSVDDIDWTEDLVPQLERKLIKMAQFLGGVIVS